MNSKCELKHLPIDQVVLDRNNPRIAKALEMYKSEEIGEEELGLALGQGGNDGPSGSNTTYTSLKESIRIHGGIIHPIIVNKISDETFLVIEGNTRVFIYRKLRERGVKGNWNTIPALVYSNLSSVEVNAIRLQAHLVGPRPWDPYSKAKYLNSLYQEGSLTLPQIVEFCGGIGKQQEVMDYIEAYNDMEKYYRKHIPSDHDFDSTRFSAFVELQKGSVRSSLKEAGFSKDDFAKWVIQEKFPTLNLVRVLPKILKNPEALKIFERRDAKEAAKFIEIEQGKGLALPSLGIHELCNILTIKILNMPYSGLSELRKSGPENFDIICQTRDQLDSLCVDIASGD